MTLDDFVNKVSIQIIDSCIREAKPMDYMILWLNIFLMLIYLLLISSYYFVPFVNMGMFLRNLALD